MLRLVLFLLCLVPTGIPRAAPLDALKAPWPSAEATAGIIGHPFGFPSASPFTLSEIDAIQAPSRDGGAPPVRARATLFLPDASSARPPVPAVVLLHGARGVSESREMTYARKLAAMGVAALVIDAFGARRDLASGFTERLIEITEVMVLADAYAALAALAELPGIDAERIALVGFSYGGMATLYAAHSQVAARFDRLYGLEGRRFAAHASYYAPCIARFEDVRATGAPVLMQWGGRDEIIDPVRCREVADDLRAGGAAVETVVYPEAYHMWDGNLVRPWRAPRGLADCDFRVTDEGVTRGRLPGTPFTFAMTDPLSRKILLGLCSDSDGYLVGRDESVRARSDAALGDFLAESFR